ncbi:MULTISPECIES: IS66 family insertion sequence element accessory protein TnpA [Vibrio]|uniref:IS66 family insertion sequence element accessory protein TnpB n=2 Tax=Vibrio TaxID=662 RepID=A0A7X4LNR6_9VIBR|nr:MULTISPECIES: IS66 family insertion sequence element accessory protein TnpB [Vibrio]MBF9003570.1 IS66 family insertion sequence element accessory protein TnpB [Vibrio nitrifigilis]MZI95037.1 IS66 family insertion sequence element accessory protein TnpB [Vibrio eleionomae]
MYKRRTDQEWLSLIEQCQASSLTQHAFCQKHDISVSTFYAKRQKLSVNYSANQSGFVKAEMIEKTTCLKVTQTSLANMTLIANNVELSIPQGTPTHYLAELIGALS